MRKAMCAALLLSACGGEAADHGRITLNRITDAADPTYELAVQTCDEAREQIIAREGTTYEQDVAAFDKIGDICDPMVAGFESLRAVQLSARAALRDGSLSSTAAAIVGQALVLWEELQTLLPSLESL